MKVKAEITHVFIIAVICVCTVLLTSCSNTSQAESTNKESKLAKIQQPKNIEHPLKTIAEMEKHAEDVALEIGTKVETNLLGIYENDIGGMAMEVEIVNNSPYTLWSYEEVVRKADGSEDSVVENFTLIPGDKYKETLVYYNTQNPEDFEDCRIVTRSYGVVDENDLHSSVVFNYMRNKVTVGSKTIDMQLNEK